MSEPVELPANGGDGGLDAREVARILGALCALNFFPAEDKARWAIFRIVGDMATDLDQVRWLARRMLELFDTWPGPRTLRAVFCSRFAPKDGINLNCCESLPGGTVPPERPVLATAELKALPPGSDDKGVDAAFNILNFAVKEKCREFNAKATPEEIAAAPEWLKKLEGYE